MPRTISFWGNDKIATHDGTLIGLPTVMVTTNVESVPGAMFAVNARSPAFLVMGSGGLKAIAATNAMGRSMAKSHQIK
ncbi:MAG TPA: hypothetical protein VK589_17400 [Chryseolinea sp.]|nr:hypothetical protein [Chryseolinea sp.]